MGRLILKTGSIWSSYAGGIGHGVNTHGVMGSGIAVQFKERFPDMYQQYRRMCLDDILEPGMIFPYLAGQSSGGREMYVYNIASQDAPGPNAKYKWLLMGVCRALEHAEEVGIATIALPRIGAGVGGLDWRRVEERLVIAADSFDVSIEVWSLPEVAKATEPTHTFIHADPKKNPLRADGLYGKAAAAADGDWYGSH